MNGLTFQRLATWRTIVGLPMPVTNDADQAMLVEDDPETLARLAAIMSDHARLCPLCRRDLKICDAIGCDAEISFDAGAVESAAPALLPAQADRPSR